MDCFLVCSKYFLVAFSTSSVRSNQGVSRSLFTIFDNLYRTCALGSVVLYTACPIPIILSPRSSLLVTHFSTVLIFPFFKSIFITCVFAPPFIDQVIVALQLLLAP